MTGQRSLTISRGKRSSPWVNRSRQEGQARRGRDSCRACPKRKELDMKKSKYNVHEDEVQPASVQLKDGWREMNIRFLLDKKTVGIPSAVLWKAIIKAGAVHQKHVHRKADEVCYVIKGKGRHGRGDEAG